MNSVLKSEVMPARSNRSDVKPVYIEALTLVERLHRRLLDVIKDEFDRRGRCDVNSVQALLLYNIGDKELTAGELRTRGYYLGSNVSYNVKKLVEMNYLHHARSRLDRRSVRISLTPKGKEVHDVVAALYDNHVQTVEQIGGISVDESGPTRSASACKLIQRRRVSERPRSGEKRRSGPPRRGPGRRFPFGHAPTLDATKTPPIWCHLAE